MRIAHYHIGIRPAASPKQALVTALTSPRSYEVIITYTIFSWFFSQVYLWYCSDRVSALTWIAYTHHAGDRARLNEKPIFFTTYFVTLGISHGLYHIALDYDYLPLGILNPSLAGKLSGGNDNQRATTILSLINDKLPTTVTRAATTTTISLAFHTFLYALGLRNVSWSWTLSLMRLFYNLPRSNLLPASYPYHLWLFARCLWVGFLLSFLWTAANVVFTELMNAKPLKRGKPLTSESKDPNGSLLNGLKSNKQSVKGFAAWEFAFVAHDFTDRRKAIFEDIDRKDGPMWTQVYTLCTGLIQNVNERIDGYTSSPLPIAPVTMDVWPHTNVNQHARKRVGQSSGPINDVSVMIPPQETHGITNQLQKRIESFARSPGKTPLSELSPRAKMIAKEVTDHYLTPEQQATLQPSKVSELIFNNLARTLEYPFVGRFVCTRFGRRLANAIFGDGDNIQGSGVDVSIYVNVVMALSQLATHSLREDSFGNVQRDVVDLIRLFSGTAEKVLRFRNDFREQWLDAKIKVNNHGERVDKKCEEAELFLDALRQGLEALLGTFEVYAPELRLRSGDIKAAKMIIEALRDGDGEMEGVR